MRVIVVDGQGGGIGKAVVTQLRRVLPELTILALGSNSIATAAMMKAGLPPEPPENMPWSTIVLGRSGMM